jgi:hypothetical protein
MSRREQHDGEGMKMETVFRVSGPRVIYENIDGELILVHMEKGTYFNTDEVGAFIWTMVEGRATATEIVHAVEARYDDVGENIPGAVRRFLARLVDEDLAIEDRDTDAPRAAAPPAPARRQAFVVPALQAFRDMQDMLSLDPIHDVEAAGWPVPKLDDDPTIPQTT